MGFGGTDLSLDTSFTSVKTSGVSTTLRFSCFFSDAGIRLCKVVVKTK
jgi:hypothetical protein